MEESINKNEQLEAVEKSIILSISEDKMSATVMVIKPTDESTADTLKLMGKDILLNKIAEKNICYGINKEIIPVIFKKQIYDREIVIAQGLPAVEGRDGHLEYFFNKDIVKAPKLLENGNVDFHDLNILQNVEKGALLSSYTPHIENQDGCDITGKIIKLKPVKKYAIPKGKNTAFSEDGLKLFAQKDGNVEFIDNKICVSDILEIKGDVDLATGDIYFRGDIIVKENVITGFTVKATGSISVNGFVEAAYLYAGGDIILKNGIQGSNKGIISADGSLVAKFAESVNIHVKGDITIGAILNSNISCEGNLVSQGKRGFIIGGKVSAHNKLKAWSLGNMVEIPTTIEIGFTQSKSKRYYELKELINKLSEELEDLNYKIKNATQFTRLGLMREKVKKDAEYKGYISEYSRLVELKEKPSESIVEVQNVVYPKVNIYIGNYRYTTKSVINNAKFKVVGDKIIDINH